MAVVKGTGWLKPVASGLQVAGSRGFRDRDAGLMGGSRVDSSKIRRLCFLSREVMLLFGGFDSGGLCGTCGVSVESRTGECVESRCDVVERQTFL